MKILQLRRQQLPSIPFSLFLGLADPETGEVKVKLDDEYVMVPTDLGILSDGSNELIKAANTFLQLAKFKGFALLMLKYV